MQGGISSWTSKESIAEKFATLDKAGDKTAVIFRVPSTHSGTSVAHLSKYGMSEEEVLLPSTAKFKVIGSEKITPLKTVTKPGETVFEYSQEYKDFFAAVETKYGGKDGLWGKMNDNEFDRAQWLESHGVTKVTKDITERIPTGAPEYYVVDLEELI